MARKWTEPLERLHRALKSYEEECASAEALEYAAFWAESLVYTLTLEAARLKAGDRIRYARTKAAAKAREEMER